MSFERGQWNNRFYEKETSQRYIGKVQFLRQEHGYIRSKVKINGIRDVTFSFSEVHLSSTDSLAIGDIVSFRVNIYSSRKFCAVDIRKEVIDSSSVSQRSGSPVSVLSSDHSMDSPMSNIRNYAFEYQSEPSPKLDSDLGFSKDVFVIPSYEKVSEEKDQFSLGVDSFLEKVISRNYNASFTTCWLTF